jgi:hypothetical protein
MVGNVGRVLLDSCVAFSGLDEVRVMPTAISISSNEANREACTTVSGHWNTSALEKLMLFLFPHSSTKLGGSSVIFH